MIRSSTRLRARPALVLALIVATGGVGLSTCATAQDAPAAAPVPAPPGTPGAAAAAPDAAAVERFLVDWSEAWQRQAPAPYLAFYAPDAVVDGRARADFEKHKQELFARGTPLTIRLGDVRVGEASLGGEPLVRVTFDQEYTSSRLADFGRKEMLLRRAGESFAIVRETWTASAGVIARSLGGAPDAPAPAAPAPPPPSTPPATTAPAGEGAEPLLGSGYVPPADEAPAAAPATGGEAMAMEPLLGEPFDIVQPDYGLPKMVAGEGGRNIVEEIVANVNGQVLTRAMLLQRIGWYESTLLEDNPPDLETKLSKLAEATLDITIDRWLILQEANSRSMNVEGYWREWLAQTRRDSGAESLEEFEEMLREQGSSLAELRQQVLETQVPDIYLQQALGEEITFTETEIQEHFEANRARFERPKAVTLRQILIPVAPDEDPHRAKAVADAAVSSLREGKDWCQVHEIYSSGGPQCGDLGEIAVDDLLPELREAAVGVPVGAVSLPLLSPQGWHILRVVARAGMEPVELAEVRDRVLAELRGNAYQSKLASYLDELRATSQIAVSPRYKTSRDWAALHREATSE